MKYKMTGRWVVARWEGLEGGRGQLRGDEKRQKKNEDKDELVHGAVASSREKKKQKIE